MFLFPRRAELKDRHSGGVRGRAIAVWKQQRWGHTLTLQSHCSSINLDHPEHLEPIFTLPSHRRWPRSHQLHVQEAVNDITAVYVIVQTGSCVHTRGLSTLWDCWCTCTANMRWQGKAWPAKQGQTVGWPSSSSAKPSIPFLCFKEEFEWVVFDSVGLE